MPPVISIIFCATSASSNNLPQFTNAFVTLVLLLGLSGTKQYKEDLIKDNKELGLVDKKEKSDNTDNKENSNSKDNKSNKDKKKQNKKRK